MVCYLAILMKRIFKNKPGIYAIIVRTPLKTWRYIGQSTKLALRISHHKSALKSQRHGNQIMQRLYNKYGADSFTFKVVFYCIPEVMNIIETCLIQSYANLNLAPVVQKGFKMPQEVKDKISKALKGNPQKVNKKHSKPKRKDVHYFVNLLTGEEFIGTGLQLRKKYPGDLKRHHTDGLINGKTKLANWWYIKGTKLNARNIGKNTVFVFKKGSFLFKGTIQQFRGLPGTRRVNVWAILTKKVKTHKGWTVRPD